MNTNRDDRFITPDPVHPSDLPRNPNEEQNLRLLEERVLVNRYRRKVGEVIVRKVVETQMIEVPVRLEKLVVEQISPERKQLACVNLNPELLANIAIPQDELDSQQPAINETFIDARTADRILEEIAENPVYRTAKVKIVFEDAALQSTYEQWLKHRLSEEAQTPAAPIQSPTSHPANEVRY
ncbi:DUF2382 domain-containing protein [Egbenema bharatensis]|uniref:DUF2382 domain-containing protein n=1 Tax=Egbenema bharatensis TaxID=3463334 RepID=UPI003A8977DB